MAARLAGVPIVVRTLHGFYFTDQTAPFKRSFFSALERISAHLSDTILSQNSEDIGTAVALGICPAEKITYLGNGIDVELFDPARFSDQAVRAKKAELGLPPGVPVLGIVGRLGREKGYVEFMEAMQTITAEMPDVHALCIGELVPEKPDALRPSIIDDYGLSQRVKFLGFRLDMPELFSVIDLLLFPSHREGFPRSPMEASAMGVPVVTSDIRGCREAVVDGENGLMVPVRDSAALAHAALELLRDRERTRALGARGRAIALERFDERRVFERVNGTYRRLLKDKGIVQA